MTSVGSLGTKSKSAVVSRVGLGGPLRNCAGWGTDRFRVQPNADVGALWLPAWSVLRTASVCAPGVATVKWNVLGQALQPALSRLHSTVAESSGLSTRKSTPVWLVVVAGPVRIDGVGGAVVSTTHSAVPGNAALPAPSDAETVAKVCDLGRKLLYNAGPRILPVSGPPWDDNPAAFLCGLESTAEGCRWLLERWTVLGDMLEREAIWTLTDLYRSIRLQGKYPVDAINDPDLNLQIQAWEMMSPGAAIDRESLTTEGTEGTEGRGR